MTLLRSITTQKTTLVDGQLPIDYRHFEKEKPATDYRVLELHWNVGEHLAFLFRTKQWCFGEQIVELAEIEDIEEEEAPARKHSIIPMSLAFPAHTAP